MNSCTPVLRRTDTSLSLSLSLSLFFTLHNELGTDGEGAEHQAGFSAT